MQRCVAPRRSALSRSLLPPSSELHPRTILYICLQRLGIVVRGPNKSTSRPRYGVSVRSVQWRAAPPRGQYPFAPLSAAVAPFFSQLSVSSWRTQKTCGNNMFVFFGFFFGVLSFFLSSFLGWCPKWNDSSFCLLQNFSVRGLGRIWVELCSSSPWGANTWDLGVVRICQKFGSSCWG